MTSPRNFGDMTHTLYTAHHTFSPDLAIIVNIAATGGKHAKLWQRQAIPVGAQWVKMNRHVHLYLHYLSALLDIFSGTLRHAGCLFRTFRSAQQGEGNHCADPPASHRGQARLPPGGQNPNGICSLGAPLVEG